MFRVDYNLIIENGRLAQLGEHLPYKEGVTGSRPVSPTTFQQVFRFSIPFDEISSGRLAQLGEHLPYKEGVTGSRPVSPTTLDSHHKLQAIANAIS